MNYGFSTYQKINKTVVSPIAHVIAIYKDCIKEMEAALAAHREERYEDRYRATEKARKMIGGLQEALFRETPEARDMAETLDQFYTSLKFMILHTNARNDEKYCIQAIESLKTMLATWVNVSEQQMQASAPPAPESLDLAAVRA